jgi:hypothetical protein
VQAGKSLYRRKGTVLHVHLSINFGLGCFKNKQKYFSSHYQPIYNGFMTSHSADPLLPVYEIPSWREFRSVNKRGEPNVIPPSHWSHPIIFNYLFNYTAINLSFTNVTYSHQSHISLRAASQCPTKGNLNNFSIRIYKYCVTRCWLFYTTYILQKWSPQHTHSFCISGEVQLVSNMMLFKGLWF